MHGYQWASWVSEKEQNKMEESLLFTWSQG